MLALRLWAKTEPFHPLICHMLDAGITAQALLATTCFNNIAVKFTEATDCPTNIDPSSWLAYLTAMHDIGKAHAGFQKKAGPEFCASLEKAGIDCRYPFDGFRHDGLSGRWILDFLQENGWPRQSAWTVSLALRGHHSDFSAGDPEDGIPEDPLWEKLRTDVEKTIRDVFSPKPWRAEFLNHSITGIILSGVIVLSDWIASNNELFPKEAGECKHLDIAEYVARSRRLAAAAIGKLGFNVEIDWSEKQLFTEVWRGTGFSPRPIQKRCEELCKEGLPPGLAIIEAPMGEGKTEAAIYLGVQWLNSCDLAGFYLALPTAATSNQMYDRFSSFLNVHDTSGSQSVRLVHGTAWMHDSATPTYEPSIESSNENDLQDFDWFQPKKRSLLAPFGVGTIDQALMSVLHVRFGFLRLFGLAGKVLVIDEVHAYDAYMSAILELLLKWCNAIKLPVIMLSATLPAEKRATLVKSFFDGAEKELACSGALTPYPLLTFVSSDGEVKEEPIEPSSRKVRIFLQKEQGILEDYQAIANIIAERAARGGCHCVIMNTVDAAQKVYQLIKQIHAEKGIQDVPTLLFHSRFRAKRRQEIEKAALALFGKQSLSENSDAYIERPAKAILVATQVVEQSLDLDFDEMYSQIAPIDLLLQRVGRLHRHDRKTRPTGDKAYLHVFLPAADSSDFGATAHVYENRFIMLKTLHYLNSINEMSLPSDIRGLVENVYGDSLNISGIDSHDLKEAWEHAKHDSDEDKKAARLYLIPEPKPSKYGLAEKLGMPFEDVEGKSKSYFAAKTRLGDPSTRLLVLNDLEFEDMVSGKKKPFRDGMKELMLQSVSVPEWWFLNVTAASGFAALEPAPRWLKGLSVIRTRNHEWKGVDGNGHHITISDDDELGMKRTKEV